MRGEAEFGLPVAIILYLRLLLYAAGGLLLMFLISLPQTLENRRHFLVRLDCRDALRSDYAALTATDAVWEATDADSWSGYTGCATANASALGLAVAGTNGTNGTNGSSSSSSGGGGGGSYEYGSGNGDDGAWVPSNATAWRATMSAMRATCGYAGLGELRCDNPAVDAATEGYLSLSLGSCMEYDEAQSRGAVRNGDRLGLGATAGHHGLLKTDLEGLGAALRTREKRPSVVSGATERPSRWSEPPPRRTDFDFAASDRITGRARCRRTRCSISARTSPTR